MKAYLICTGLIFAVLGVAQGVRLFVEGDHAGSTDSGFVLAHLALCLGGVGFAVWARSLLRRQRTQNLLTLLLQSQLQDAHETDHESR
jgi:hypothetical protein